MNQTQINLAILEARLAMRTEEWIEDKLADDHFFPKLENILKLSNNKAALRVLNLDKVFNADGTTKSITEYGHNFDLGMLE